VRAFGSILGEGEASGDSARVEAQPAPMT
jgi:hypothetical protein